MSQSTRRGFLGTLGALAGAAPLALAGAGAAPVKSAAPPPKGNQSEAWRFCQHGVEYGQCGGQCPACDAAHDAFYSHPLVLNALAATKQAMSALSRVAQDEGDLARDAAAVRYALWGWYNGIEGEVGETRFRHLAPPAAPAPFSPEGAATLALYDALDALLDLTAGHADTDPDGYSCHICDDADHAVYFVSMMAGFLSGSGLPRPEVLAVWERELVSDRRKVERDRRRVAEGGEFRPNTAAEHYGAERHLRDHEALIELLRPKLAASKNAVRRGGRRPANG